MKIERIGEQLAVMIPADVAAQLGLHEGDVVEVRAKPVRLSDERLAQIRAEMTALARPLPTDYRFDREELNAR